MNLKKIEKKVHAVAPSVKVEEQNGCVRLSGTLNDWDTVYKAGIAAIDRKHSLGVLNDIKLEGFEEKIKTPSILDNALDGMTPDVLVIGGGIAGCAVLRELSKLDISSVLVEKCSDVAVQTSSRNDGCIHPGIDLHIGQQKLYYVRKGNAMYNGSLPNELGVKFERLTQVLMFSKRWETKVIAPLFKLKAKILKIPCYYATPEQLKRVEPHSPEWLKGAMVLTDAGVVSPYKTTIAFAENAIENGAKVYLNTMVTGMDVKDGEIKSVSTNRGTIYPRLVINCAGVFSDVIADMAKDRTFTIHPRKGTDLILDKKKAGYALSSYQRSAFVPLPKEAMPDGGQPSSHTKGGGIMRTIDGNILVGPDAVEQPYREDTTTDLLHISNILKKQKVCVKDMSMGDIITYFAGIRAATYEEDFVVRKGIFTKNIIEVAGIQSPGITAAPAIACDVRDWAKEYFKANEKKDFNPYRTHTPKLSTLSDEEREKYIKKNPDYGEIICRCEEVSKGEIIDALNAPLKVCTLDGIKRRVRPGMGRCQGGFCGPLIVKIIAEHEGISQEDVLKGEEGSKLLYSDSKEAKNEG